MSQQICFLLLCVVVSVLGAGPVVQTKFGPIQGIEQPGVYSFRGIPFAQAPLGSLRWAPPQPTNDWAPSTWDATKYRGDCPQPGNYSGGVTNIDEDCLYLNIYAPSTPSKTPLPVMMFIYGGGWMQGTANDPLYYGNYFANTTGVILVAANYRLGALGFVVTPEHPGNFAILDQRAAIEWVSENIAAFGGDPAQITLFGQSAGGISIGIHMTSPMTTPGLFRGAIIQSNPITVEFRTTEQNLPCALIFAKLLGCNEGDMTCLRNKTVDEILRAQSLTLCIPPEPIRSADEMPWQPTIDGVNILDAPLTLMEKGKYLKMPVIIGTVLNETTSFVHQALKNSMPIMEYIQAIYALFPQDVANTILSFYTPDELSSSTLSLPLSSSRSDKRSPRVKQLVQGVQQLRKGFTFEETPSHETDSNTDSGDDARPIFAILLTDWLFICPARRAARAFSANNDNLPVYEYSFQHYPVLDPINNTTYCKNAACHGAELTYVFDSASFAQAPFATGEEPLAEAMLKNWGAFASGQPTELAKFSTSSDTINVLNTGSTLLTTTTGFRKKFCDMWDTITA